MSRIKTKTLCRIAAFAALYFLLTMVSVRAGNLHVTFSSLPIVVSALLFGPLETAAAALLGEFLNQMLSYGFTLTTPLWLIPPAIRGLLIGAAALWFRRRGRPLEERPAWFLTICTGAALVTTACNTAAILADSLIFHYYTPTLIMGDLVLRILSGVITAVCVALVAMPLTRLLRSQPALRSLL